MERKDEPRQALHRALIALLGKMPLEKVTVSALCREAGISRMAFYRRYENLKPLLAEVARDYVANLQKTAAEAAKRHDPQRYYTALFQMIRENTALVSSLYSGNVFDLLMRESESTSQLSYETCAYQGAMHLIVYVWLHAGMPQTPEEMAKTCMKIMDHRQTFSF